MSFSDFLDVFISFTCKVLAPVNCLDIIHLRFKGLSLKISPALGVLLLSSYARPSTASSWNISKNLSQNTSLHLGRATSSNASSRFFFALW